MNDNERPSSAKPRRIGLALTGLALLVLAACAGNSAEQNDAASTSTTSTAAASSTPQTDDTAAEPDTSTPTDDTAIDLINCESNIGDDVPVFYSTYFRCTDISVDGDIVVISGSDLPPHLSYYYGEASDQFEEFDYSRGDRYRPSPNQIAQTTFTLRIPLDPVRSGIAIDSATVNLMVGDGTDYPQGIAGVALDGVALFNPLAAPGDDIEDEKYTFDSLEGHPQQQGTYHYHAVAVGPLAVLQALGFTTSETPGLAEIELYGVMCDGTVVMGANELDASAPEGDRDLQAGHSHDIVDGNGTVLLENRYHIHIAPTIGAEPRGLTPEAQYYNTC